MLIDPPNKANAQENTKNFGVHDFPTSQFGLKQALNCWNRRLLHRRTHLEVMTRI